MNKMKSVALALVLATSLGGCQFFKNVETAFVLGTASVANPVTKDRLFQLENAAILAFSGLEAWKTSCAQGLIPPSCKAQIGEVQFYTRQIPTYRDQLRVFVKKNDQVNATIMFNEITGLIDKAKAQAATSGQNLGN